jgi:hypothetical protein
MKEEAGWMEFNSPRLELLIVALRDAIRFAQEELGRMPGEQQPE